VAELSSLADGALGGAPGHGKRIGIGEKRERRGEERIEERERKEG
jgi:hypothetical protein